MDSYVINRSGRLYRANDLTITKKSSQSFISNGFNTKSNWTHFS